MDFFSTIFYTIAYWLTSGLCWVINILDKMFSVMSGLTQVNYNGKPYYLINVFFENSTVQNIYWAS